MSVYFNGQEVGPIMQYIPEDTSSNLYKGVLDGSIKKFDNRDTNLKTLLSHRFMGAQLEYANFEGITTIPTYSCYNCTNLKDLLLDPMTSNIESYAFEGCNLTGAALMINNKCVIGSNAFYATKMDKLIGNFGKISSQAFAQNTKLTYLDITINGSVNSSAFSGLNSVSVFKFNPESIITGTLPTSIFNGLGQNRANPATNIFEIDLSNSIFSLASMSSLGGLTYTRVILPNTLVQLDVSTFTSSKNSQFYFKSLVPPTAQSNSFSSITNCKFCVPYGALNNYKTATNWATMADDIIGYEESKLFKPGDTLPVYSSDGRLCTWYKDLELTTLVEDVLTKEDLENKYYYCSVSEEQHSVIKITGITEIDCEVLIINADSGYVYKKTEGIPIGVRLRLQANPTKTGYIPYSLTLNGLDVDNSYEFVATEGIDLAIVSIFYDGINDPVNLDFAQNSWAVIKKVVQNGDAGKYWPLGVTKTLRMGSYTYTMRLVDLKPGRYDYANGTRKTNAVFLSDEVTQSTYSINSNSTNAGGWAECDLRTKLNTTILDTLPDDFKSLLDDIMIQSNNGGSTNFTEITKSANKLFLPAFTELGYVNYGNTAVRDVLANESEEYGYFDSSVSSNDLKSRRLKYAQSSSGLIYIEEWWLRTPAPQSLTYFCYIDPWGGQNSNGGSYTSNRVPICFAW